MSLAGGQVHPDRDLVINRFIYQGDKQNIIKAIRGVKPETTAMQLLVREDVTFPVGYKPPQEFLREAFVLIIESGLAEVELRTGLKDQFDVRGILIRVDPDDMGGIGRFQIAQVVRLEAQGPLALLVKLVIKGIALSQRKLADFTEQALFLAALTGQFYSQATDNCLLDQG